MPTALMNHMLPRILLGFHQSPISYVCSLPGHAMQDPRVSRTTKNSSTAQAKNGVPVRVRFFQNYLTSGFRFFRLKMMTISIRWRLVPSPTKNNELPSMELSWTWEFNYKERACINYTGKRSLCLFFSRNSDR